jgi:hypothetical protein
MADEATVPEGAAEVDTSTRGSVERAFAAVAGRDEAPEVETPEVESEEAPAVERARGPDGKFIAKDADVAEAPVEAAPEIEAPVAAPEAAPTLSEPVGAPTRFSAEAKAAWATTPPAVQAEIGRAFSEMEKGIGEYRARFEPLRQYDDMARQQGTTLAAAMANYVGLEDALRQNPLQGLDRVCQNLGLSLRDVAAHVMGQPAPERDQQVMQLTQHARDLEAQLQQYQAKEAAAQQERMNATLETVQKFASESPRYGELEHYIKWALETQAVPRTGDPSADLKNAYEFAARLIPGAEPPAPVAAPAATAAPAQPVAQTPKKAGISIDGAPSGSNPAAPRSKSTNEAVKRALSQVGL